MNIDTQTALYGVIGHPVAHSLSPRMHNHAFQAAGINGVYLAFDTTDLAGAVSGIRSLGIRGASVTIPHKIAIMDHLDAIDETAERIGAVNTVVNRDEKLIGYNTDAAGAMAALEAVTGISGRDVLIVGAGGAARAIGFGVKQKGGRVHIVNRTERKGQRLAADLEGIWHPTDALRSLSFDILINTTSIGMTPQPEGTPVPGHFFRPGICVMDIVYNPVKTRLLKEAEAAGCGIVDGVAMFVNQGALQFEMWTGRTAPVAAMRRIVYDALQ